MAFAVDVEDLHKTYRSGVFSRRDVHALRGVSFQIPRGEIFGLLGPNGAGKTTLIKILLGIVRKSKGNGALLGHPVGHLESRRRVGYLPEGHRLPKHLTGFTALEYYGNLSGVSCSAIRAQRDALLKLVGLDKWGRVSVRKYSKGMQQRLGLAQALLHNPELLILDEPTDGVDPVGRKEIREILRDFRSKGGTVFLNSHLLQETELVCDRVAVLHKGRVVSIGTVDKLTSVAGEDAVLQLHVGREEAVRLLAPFGLRGCEAKAPQRCTATMRVNDLSQLNEAIDALRAAGVLIESIARQRRSLEDAFLEIVGEEGEA